MAEVMNDLGIAKILEQLGIEKENNGESTGGHWLIHVENLFIQFLQLMVK